MESSISSDPALRFVEMFEAAEQATDEARQNSELSRDYYDNKQYTEEEANELKKRGQPLIIDNVIAGKINWLIGQEMSTRTDPKGFPRTPQHEKGAEAVTDAIRFVCDNNNWSIIRSSVWKNLLLEGFGGIVIGHVMKRNGPEITYKHIPWDRLFYDPHSRKEDFSDARYLGEVIWQDVDELRRKHPEVKDSIDGALNRTSTLGETYEDRPQHQIWGDKARNRVRVVLMHYLEDDVWKWCKFSFGLVLDKGESAYRDEDGESMCPLLIESAYVDRENNRYGEAWKYISQQDEINKRRSKLLHMANSRQTMGEKGAIDSVVKLKRELAKPDGHVEYNPGVDGKRPFEIIPTADVAASQFALLQEAKESIEGMGATEALQGSADGDSGRAVLAKQQGALRGITPLTDRLHWFTLRVYKMTWMLIRQLWTEEKWIRVTDDEHNVKFVGLNRPVSLQEELQNRPFEEVRDIALNIGLVPGDARLQQPVRIENAVEEIEVDIVIDEVPDTITLEAETFEQLVNIDAARGGALPFEMLIEASPLRSKVKEKILSWFEEQKQQQAQQGQQGADIQQQFAQAELAEKAAGIQETQSRTEKNQSDTMKNVVEAQRLAIGA